MKNNIITIMLILVVITGCSQNPKYEYPGRLTPSVKKELLKDADYISEIMPEFSSHFALIYGEHDLFKEKLKLMYYTLDNVMDPQYNYTKIIEFVSIEISGRCNGNTLSAKSSGNRLTMEQKSILNTVDLGSDLYVSINFVYKNQAKIDLREPNKIREGSYTVTVVPETEAEFPGGNNQLSAYLDEKVFNKIAEGKAYDKIMQARVNFMVNEDGQVVDVKIHRSSYDTNSDNLLLDAFNKMPKWIPAKNSKGIKVKQEFSIPLGSGGC